MAIKETPTVWGIVEEYSAIDPIQKILRVYPTELGARSRLFVRQDGSMIDGYKVVGPLREADGTTELSIGKDIGKTAMHGARLYELDTEASDRSDALHDTKPIIFVFDPNDKTPIIDRDNSHKFIIEERPTKGSIIARLEEESSGYTGKLLVVVLNAQNIIEGTNFASYDMGEEPYLVDYVSEKNLWRGREDWLTLGLLGKDKLLEGCFYNGVGILSGRKFYYDEQHKVIFEVDKSSISNPGWWARFDDELRRHTLPQ